MRILVVNTGRLPDVIQMLPAFTEAQRLIPGLVIDVLVEQRWSEVPKWHTAVAGVYTVEPKLCHSGLMSVVTSSMTSRPMAELKRHLRRQHYDWVFDICGNWLSTWAAKVVKAHVAGFKTIENKTKPCSYLYFYRHPVDETAHNIERIHQLMSHCLGYNGEPVALKFGLDSQQFCRHGNDDKVVALMLGARFEHLRLPFDAAKALINQLEQLGYRIRLIWRDRESGDYLRTLAENTQAELLPKLKLSGIASVLMEAGAVVSVDNGLSHLAAAFGAPMIRLQQADSGVSNTALGGDQRVIYFNPSAGDNLELPGKIITCINESRAGHPRDRKRHSNVEGQNFSDQPSFA